MAPATQNSLMPQSSLLPPLKRLFGFTRAHRGRIFLATDCSILNKIFDPAPPLLIGMVVDVVVRVGNGEGQCRVGGEDA